MRFAESSGPRTSELTNRATSMRRYAARMATLRCADDIALPAKLRTAGGSGHRVSSLLKARLKTQTALREDRRRKYNTNARNARFYLRIWRIVPEILALRGNSSAQSLPSYGQCQVGASSSVRISHHPGAGGEMRVNLAFFGVVRPISTSIIRSFAFGLERSGRPLVSAGLPEFSRGDPPSYNLGDRASGFSEAFEPLGPIPRIGIGQTGLSF